MALPTSFPQSQPNMANKQKPDVSDLGKSRTAFWDAASTVPQVKYLKYRNVKANFTIALPANVRLDPEIVIFNESANTQAAITVGTSAAGTQIDTGATTATKTTAVRAGTSPAISRAASTIYVESSAWQTGVNLVFKTTEYPPSADTSALS